MGDFNFPNGPWLLGCSPGSSSVAAYNWHEFTLANDLDALFPEGPMQDHGNVLDGAWASPVLFFTNGSIQISLDLEACSDHLPILISILIAAPARSDIPKKLSIGPLNEPAFDEILQLLLRSFPSPGPFRTTSQLNRDAGFIVSCINPEAKQTCKTIRCGRRALPYWSADCREAVKDVQATQRTFTWALFVLRPPRERASA